ncbi:MAG: hypothetical protein AAGC72_12530 [Planctomycetota bacterium]
MHDDVSPGWQLVAIVIENQEVDLLGINPWNQEWVSLNIPPIVVAHPQYPNQKHKMSVYTLEANPPIKFAAGEFSASVWGFYVLSDTE